MATMAVGRRGRRLFRAPLRSVAAVTRDTTFAIAGIPVHLIAIAVLIAPWANRYAMHLGKKELLALVVASAVLVLALRAPLTTMQRHRCWSLLGLDIPAASADRGVPWPRRAGRSLRSDATWRQLAYHLAVGPVLALCGLATLATWAGGAGLTGWGAWTVGGNLYRLVFATPTHALPGKAGVVAPAVGLVLLIIAPFLARATTLMDTRAARALLGPSRSRELELRVETLSESRAGVVDAADAERRRIERDLHDGAQQRLVSLAMNLGMARENLTDLPDEVRQVIAEAHEEAKEALAELRTLVRGLHPAVLEDRGLDAALSGIAARAPLPVRLSVEAGHRASPTVEAVAYFVVSECLANIARHSGATRAEIDVRRDGGTLHIRVLDDGVGGADPALGTGLSSLAQRAASVDGKLRLDSPAGGPTVVSVELPCAS
jgi:signal transduction histidine kinase